jgi:hypothetical protein
MSWDIKEKSRYGERSGLSTIRRANMSRLRGLYSCALSASYTL